MAATLLAFALLLLPGLALLALWPSQDGWGLGRRLLAAPGLSLAAVALLFQFSWATGLRLDRWLIGLFAAGAGLVAVVWAIRAGRGLSLPRLKQAVAATDWLPGALLAFVFGLTLHSRLQAVSGLEIPLWWDSVHHTTIVQLMLENGGIFSSWQPYVPLSTFTYHFGFHAMAAGLAWLSGLTAPATVLLLGQVLNACSVPVGYLLAERLTGRAWAGVAAALVTGLVSLMPSYYVNWGRYTQLAGQIILPVAMALTVEAVERGGRRRVFVASAVAAGLALTHYRVAIFYAAFAAAFVLVRWFELRRTPNGLKLELKRMAAMTVAALLLAGPWFLHLLSESVPRYLARWAAPVSQAAAEWQATYNSFRDVDAILPPHLLWPALAALALGLIWRQRTTFLLLLWVEGMFLAANPAWLGLPGTGEVSNHAVLIGLYLPVSCMLGLLAAGLLDRTVRWARLARLAPWALAGIVLVVGLWGWRAAGRVVNPYFQLVTPADLEAMAWIRQNTPVDAIFLANSERAYGGNTIVGTDAGWWIPLLAERRNTVPVMIYGTERSSPAGFAATANALEETVRSRSPVAPESLAAMRAAGVSHVYIGARGGYLVAEDLSASTDYRLDYEKDGVRVFEVVGLR